MLSGSVSLRSARSYRNTLVWSKYILGVGLIMASWASSSYEVKPILLTVILLTASWTTLCHLSEGLIFGRVFNPDLSGVAFILFIVPSPSAVIVLEGILAGLVVYCLLLLSIVVKPKVRLMRGDRLYILRHPIDRIIPFVYLAPEPLAPIFQPIPAFHWGVGAFNLPILKISVFDPLSIHDHVRNLTCRLILYRSDWVDALACFRRALGLLNLLDAIRKSEKTGLDGVALAASVRLALSTVPDQGRGILREVLKTLNPDRQRLILAAFDLKPSRSF